VSTRARPRLRGPRRNRRVIALTVAATLAGLGLLAAAVGSSGLYNVAASTGHWRIVDVILRFSMERSVKARAPAAAPIRLDDEAMVRLGASHFELGCAQCHGSPARPVSPVSLGMLPPPPDLAERVGAWSDGELFWIVRHGIKYAGMPAWPAQRRDDEVWTMVAFLRRLPSLDAATYRRLAHGLGATLRLDEPPRAQAGAFARCAACHGAGERPDSSLVPVLQGQDPARLAAALTRYRSGERASGIMQRAVFDLSVETLRTLAEAYAAMPVPQGAPPPDADRDLARRGEVLARQGDPGRGVPACLGCHAAGGLAVYPRLDGQPARFLVAQIEAFRSGANEHGPGAVMTFVARRMSAEDIAAAAAYFAARPHGAAP